jgi:hypothetical protein
VFRATDSVIWAHLMAKKECSRCFTALAKGRFRRLDWSARESPAGILHSPEAHMSLLNIPVSECDNESDVEQKFLYPSLTHPSFLAIPAKTITSKKYLTLFLSLRSPPCLATTSRTTFCSSVDCQSA